MQNAARKITSADIYLDFLYLPDACRPCWVVRVDGATLVTVDPRTTRLEMTSWGMDHLTDTEMNAYRAAYGGPPIGEPGPDEWTDDDLVDLRIPPELRLKGANDRVQ